MVEDGKFSVSIYGYNKNQVDKAIANMEAEFATKLKEKELQNKKQEQKIQDLIARYDKLVQETGNLVEQKQRIAETLVKAEDTASKVLKDAKDKAQKTLDTVRKDAEEEKRSLDTALEKEREQVVDIKRSVHALRAEITKILQKFDVELKTYESNVKKPIKD